jgi:hypothetical protein
MTNYEPKVGDKVTVELEIFRVGANTVSIGNNTDAMTMYKNELAAALASRSVVTEPQSDAIREAVLAEARLAAVACMDDCHAKRLTYLYSLESALIPRCQAQHPEGGQCELREGHTNDRHLAGMILWPVAIEQPDHDDLPITMDEEDVDEEEDRDDTCMMCGKPIPIEGFCCEEECLEAAVKGPPASDPQPSLVEKIEALPTCTPFQCAGLGPKSDGPWVFLEDVLAIVKGEQK